MFRWRGRYPDRKTIAMPHRRRPYGIIIALLPIALYSGLLLRTAYSRAHRYVASVRVGEFETRPKSEALVEAVACEDLAAVRRLLDRGVSPDAVNDPRDTEGKSALQIAAGTGNVALVQLLLDRGADINAPDVWGGTAIFVAAMAAGPEVVKLLISRGADVNANDDGVTALGFAAHQMAETKDGPIYARYAEVIDLLKRAGAREEP
jgi:Ankyrin repeats (3 copies)